MRSTPFIIEIPDRPVYQPGSGPAMAPITLQPDDSDTGWAIADAIEFQGVEQYVITPVNNPAHRVPVRKQHILDWVSAKAYEDFEYIQYKKRLDAEQEKEIKMLAKAAALGEKNFEICFARDGRKVRKPFEKYMQLEQAEDSDIGIRSERLSSPEHSPDEMSRNVVLGLANGMKRKHSIGMMPENGSLFKRRGLSSTNSPSFTWKPWKPYGDDSVRHVRVVSTENEDKTGVKVGNTLNTPEMEGMHLDLFKGHTLPAPRQTMTSPRALISLKTAVIPFAAPTVFVPASASPSQLAPKSNRSAIRPPVLVRTNNPNLSSSPDLSKTMYSPKPMFVQAPQHERTYSPVFPPKIYKAPASAPQSTSLSRTQKGTEESLKHGTSKAKSASISSAYKTVVADSRTRRWSRSGIDKSDLHHEKLMSPKLDIPDASRGRGSQNLGIDGKKSWEMDKGSPSSSSGSSKVLKWPNREKGSKITTEQSKFFARMTMVPNSKDETKDEIKVRSDESWEINGILDDKLQRLNGTLVRHYLCEWAGDYEPTWEPKVKVSAAALQKYERQKKSRRGRDPGFDGAADDDTMVENGETFDTKIIQRYDDEVQDVDETSDYEDTEDAVSDSVMFLTPDEKAGSQSRAGSVAGKLTSTRA